LRAILGLVAMVGFLLGTGLLYLIERPLVLPDWARERLEAAIDETLGGRTLRFGEVTLVVQEGYRPRLRLRDVVLSDAGSTTPLVTLREVETGLSRDAFLEGKFQPRFVRLSGGYLVVRRDESGAFQLALGEALTPVGTAPSLAQLLAEVDGLFERPEMTRLVRFEVDGLSLRFEDALVGRAWNVDGGRILLTREGAAVSLRADAALLGGQDYATVLEVTFDTEIGASEARFGVSFEDVEAGDLAAEVPALAWLTGLRAPISGALRTTSNDAGSFGPLSGTLQIGAGVLQPRDDARPIPFRGARSYFTYVPESRSLTFDELTVDSSWVSGRAEGQLYLEGMANGQPEAVIGQVRLQGVTVSGEGLYDSPQEIDEVFLDGRLRLDPFVLTIGQLAVREGEVRGVASGQITAAEGGWEIALAADIPKISYEALMPLWPPMLAPKPREWVEKNVTAGQFSGFHFAMRGAAGQKPQTALNFAFEGAEFTTVRGLPPVEGAQGVASLAAHRFAVEALAGQVRPAQGGVLDISGTQFVIPNVTVKEGPAEARVQVAGTVTGLLSLLDTAPLELMKKAGQPVVLADGRVQGEARLGFALRKGLKAEDIAVQAKGTLSAVRSSVLVPGRDLAASALDFEMAENVLRISGAARVGQVPFEGVVTLPLRAGTGQTARVEGEVELSPRFIEEFQIAVPKGAVGGSSTGQIEIALGRTEQGAFRLRSNLAGLRLGIPEIGWRFPEGARGRLEVAGRLAKPLAVERLSLEAPGLEALGGLTLRADGSLERVVFSRVKAGDWLDAPVVLVGRGAGKSPSVSISGGWIDMRKTTLGAGDATRGAAASKPTDGGGPVTLSLDRLIVSEGITLTQFVGRFETARGFDGAFKARVNGKAAITGQVLPDRGRTGFRITSEDAGAVFASAGLLKKAAGGALDLTMRPVGAPGTYDGALRVANVRLREAPAMAALLSAVSVVGLLEQLDGQGIPFQSVEADFRLTPTRATVLRSSAVGASIGLSMDGIYELKSGEMQMQGVVSPLYLLNGVGSVLTRKGEGVLGFNYRLSGTATAPRVTVNPLSIFTPGMFREIFRRPAPKVSQ